MLPIYLSAMGERDCVGLGHFFFFFLATQCPQHLGKLHRAYALIWEVELPLVTAAVFCYLREASGKVIKPHPGPCAEVSARHLELKGSQSLLGFLQTYQQ